MANGNGPVKVTWNVVLPMGALTLLGALMLVVAKDASVALNVAEQHGQELLLIRSEIQLLKGDVRDRTQLRYTSKDASRDHKYLDRDILACKNLIKEHIKNHHE